MTSCSSCGSCSLPCDCCTGTQAITPVALFNRPGLPALAYRVGTQGQFLETMKARLATITVDVVGNGMPGDTSVQTLRPLQGLTTRDTSDFSIALLDGWATIADLLSFYQERIANEGYLRTATERRSVLELANLVGYQLRPGVSAGVYLAYTLDDNQLDPTTIAAGSQSQSLPSPGQTPQAFETSDDLVARREWNDLQVRLQRPQNITLSTVLLVSSVQVSDSVNGLKAGDPVLFLFSSDGRLSAMRSVYSTSGPTVAGRSTILLNPLAPELQACFADLLALVTAMQPYLAGADGATQRAIARAGSLLTDALMDHSTAPADWPGSIRGAADGTIAAAVSALVDGFEQQIDGALAALGEATGPALSGPDNFVGGLLKPRVQQVANSLQLRRDLGTAFARGADNAPQMLLKFAPTLTDTYYPAWAGADINPATAALAGVLVLKTSAALFGAGVPRQATFTTAGVLNPPSEWLEWTLDGEATDALYLDQLYAAVAAPGYAIVRSLAGPLPVSQVLRVTAADAAQRAAYGISGKATHLRFDRDWWSADASTDMATLRSTLVWAQSQALTLVDEPIPDDVGGSSIELDALYEDLTSGRWVIVSGERTDIPGVQGVNAAELMMVSGITQGFDATLPGDTVHTTLQLATSTAYTYDRASLAVYGNVVPATNGATRNETLGNGDGSAVLQAFTLKQPPLTWVSAPTAAGAQSTLAVYVDGVQWPETGSLAWLGRGERGFISRTDDSGLTTVTFGDGTHGARLPTGVQNVNAVYRSGIGAAGNVLAGQISLLVTRPLGVQAVLNPLAATGGADPEDRDQARGNVPLSTMPLDRLVSVQDYADFSRNFAGIGKAVATRTSDGRRTLVYVTIAGAADATIDTSSDLYRNLLSALRLQGDPELALRVDVRELRVLLLSAGVALLPDYTWEPVAAAVRAQLLASFGFEQRALGQPARLSEVIAAIQGVAGVAYVDVATFTSVPEMETAADGTRQLITQAAISTLVAVALGAGKQSVARSRAGQRSSDVAAFAGGNDRGVLRPAELAIFAPEVADTLILNQLSS